MERYVTKKLYLQFQDPYSEKFHFFKDPIGNPYYAVEVNSIKVKFMRWFDKYGTWITETKWGVFPKNGLTYWGIAHVPGPDPRPQWLLNMFRPNQNYNVKLFHHKSYGLLYLIYNKKENDMFGRYFTDEGIEIKIPFSNILQNDQRDELRKWLSNLEFISLC
jgi:hypothetical protein